MQKMNRDTDGVIEKNMFLIVLNEFEIMISEILIFR